LVIGYLTVKSKVIWFYRLININKKYFNNDK